MKYRIVQDGNGVFFIQRKKSLFEKWETISLGFKSINDAKYIYNSFIFTVIKIKKDLFYGEHEPNWISVKDRLPPEKIFNSIYVVTINSLNDQKKFVRPLHYINGKWFTLINEEPLSIDYEVTYWMPLPDPK